MHSLYRAKEITKKVHSNIMKSIKLWNRMDTIFMNSENSKTPDPHRLLLSLSVKINLKWSDKYVALLNLSIYYIRKNINKLYKNNKFKWSDSTWYEEIELLFTSYYVSDNPDYVKFILKKHAAVTDNPSIMIYADNRTTFKIKRGYYLELLTAETMTYTKSKIIKDENGENVSHLQITEVIFVHCNIVNNDYQQDSYVLCTFVLNKSFGQLLDISPRNFIFLKSFKPEFSYIEAWFTDQNYKHLDIEDK